MKSAHGSASLAAPRRHWELAVLCLLRERAMHPYEMRRLMKLRHKDERLVLRPGSLYNAVSALLEAGAIEAVETRREGARPHRTIYRITPAGKARIPDQIAGMIAEVGRDVSSFAVALDHLVHLSPAAAAVVLQRRQAALAAAVADMRANLATLTPRIGRINLIEVEHDLVLCEAEHAWLGRIIAELRAGTLSWNLQEILAAVRKAAPKSRPAGARN